MDAWTGILDTVDAPARWGGEWTGNHRWLHWLHILCDLGIGAAYLAIPCLFAYCVLKRDGLPFRRILLPLGGFLILTGASHLMEAVVFWWPAHRLAGVLKFLTAVASWTVLFSLVRVAPRAMAIRSPEQSEREVAARQAAEWKWQRLNQELEQRIQQRTAELEDATARTESVLNHVIDGIITIDGQGTVTTFNPAAERIFGYRADEVIGRNVKVLMPEPYRSEHDGYIAHYLDTRDAKIIGTGREVQGRRRDGSAFPMDLAVSEFILGGRRYFTGIVRDITDRKRLEQQLQERLHELAEAEERTRSVVDHVIDGIITIDEQGDVRTFNPAAERIFGYRAGEVIGRNVKVLMPEPYRSEHDGYIAHYLDTGDARVIGIGREVVGRRRDGSTFPMDLAVSDFHLKGRRYFTGIVRDISDRKRVEDELRQIAAQLSEADRRKTEFLATLAHELRNPLAPIRTGLEVQKLIRDDPVRLEEVRSTMERQTRLLITLVDDLLDVSRITRGKLRLRKGRVTLQEVVQSAVEAARPVIDEANHELTVELPEGPTVLEADPHRLAQVFSNLLNNAAKYTPAGGRIRLAARRQGGEVVVSVTDTGVGIPPDKLGLVFEMFSQIEGPMEKTAGGLGIGLTLVQSLVEMHGGAVEVHSDGPGRGSEFRVRLPLPAETPAGPQGVGGPAEAVPEEVAPPRAGLRVLVVDDNQAAAEMLCILVKMLGNEVRTAGDGLEGVEAAAEYRPDVILMDLGMPRMNGYEAARHLRQQPWGEEVMLVALTGWGQEEDRQRTTEAGFDHHLVKPAEPAELQRLFAQLEVQLRDRPRP